jgi:hypothetical protein
MKTLHYILPLILIPFAFLYSQWRLANGTEGHYVTDVEIYYNDPDTVYAFGNDLLLSTDRGENWDSVGPGQNGIFKIDPANSKRLYLNHAILPLNGNEVKMTTDGGLSWETLFWGMGPPQIDQPIVETDPVDLATVYVTLNFHNLLRSTDHGNNWDTIPPPDSYSFSSLAVAPSDNNIIYVGSSAPSRVNKSTDRGETWNLLPFPLTEAATVLIAIHPKNTELVYAAVYSNGFSAGGVFKSTDGGLSWEEKNNGLSDLDLDIGSIIINPKQPDELYIGTAGNLNNDCLFKTTDGGDHWCKFTNGLPDTAKVNAIVLDTLNNRIYLGMFAFNGSGSGIYIYDGLSSVNNDQELPDNIHLYQNYPNPFNSSTIIQYDLTEGGYVNLTVYDILGKEIVNLVNDYQPEGRYRVKLNAKGFPSGIYYYSLVTGKNKFVRKAVLIK